MQHLNFAQTVARYGMDDLLRRHGAVLAAYSGGADSTCLLYLLKDLCADLGVTLYAAHVNHKIRGEAADADEQFCRKTCASLGIPLFVYRTDVPALSRERGTGLEETARDVRYAYFDRLSAELGCPLIATAHQADDNLETVLFHLLRGSGLSGLCGIDPVRDGRFLRPLIADRAAAIRAWCDENGIPYVTDATNAVPDCSRNQIRLRLTPLLDELVPDPAAAVTRMTELLRTDAAYFDDTVRDLLEPGTDHVDRALLEPLHPAIASRVLRQLYANVTFGHPTLASGHVDAMLRLLRENPSGGTAALPGGILYRQDRKTVRLIHADAAEKSQSGDAPVWSDDGLIWRAGSRMLVFSHSERICHTENDKNGENIYKLSISVSFCSDKIKGKLFVRSRLPGDRYRFGGMTRRLKKLLTDRKLSEAEKDALPVLCDDEGILWIPGFPPRDGTAYQADGAVLSVCYRVTDDN